MQNQQVESNEFSKVGFKGFVFAASIENTIFADRIILSCVVQVCKNVSGFKCMTSEIFVCNL
jgi:hypothetical protein